jgi:DNA-binding response OmpR family regulator
MRILIVEDNVELARQIKTTLEQAMYVVDVAYDGEEGLFLGDTETYDAVVLDLGLPKRWIRVTALVCAVVIVKPALRVKCVAMVR